MEEKKIPQRLIDCVKELHATGFIKVVMEHSNNFRDDKEREDRRFDMHEGVGFCYVRIYNTDTIDDIAKTLAIAFNKADEMRDLYYHNINHPNERKVFNLMFEHLIQP